MTNKHTTKANNQQKGQSKGAMSTGVTSPQNSSQNTGSIQGSSPGATDVLRQSLNVLYGSHIPQPQTVTPEATIMTNMSNINNSIDNNMSSPIGFPTNHAQQYIQNTQFPQQNAQFTQQNYQQINQQTNGANGTQQKFNASSTPQWTCCRVWGNSYNQSMGSLKAKTNDGKLLSQKLKNKISE